MIEMEKEFFLNKPSFVIVQGDTTTAFVASLAAFYQKIQIAHVEAGLRTQDIFNPFPEEVNRRLISNKFLVFISLPQKDRNKILLIPKF